MMARVVSLAALLAGTAAGGSARADVTPPRAASARPRCGSRAYRVMTDSAARACRAETREQARASCGELVRSMRTCDTGVRDEAGALVFHIPLGGEWIGARFERTAGGWSFVGFVGGDVP